MTLFDWPILAAYDFDQIFRASSANVRDSNLSGATVNASWYFDKDGTPHISMVATKDGLKVAEMKVGETAGVLFNTKEGSYIIPRLSGQQRTQSK